MAFRLVREIKLLGSWSYGGGQNVCGWLRAFFKANGSRTSNRNHNMLLCLSLITEKSNF